MSSGGRMLRALLKGANDGAGSRIPANMLDAGMVGRTEQMALPNLGPPMPPSLARGMEVDPASNLPWDMPFPPANTGYQAGPGMGKYAQFSGLPWKGRTPPDAPTLENDLYALLQANDKKGLDRFSKEHFGKPWKMAELDVINALDNFAEPMPGGYTP